MLDTLLESTRFGLVGSFGAIAAIFIYKVLGGS
jgi:hypothetical protein